MFLCLNGAHGADKAVFFVKQKDIYPGVAGYEHDPGRMDGSSNGKGFIINDIQKLADIDIFFFGW